MKKKTLSYILIALVLVVVVNVLYIPNSLVYAAESTPSISSCEWILKWLSYISRFFSRAWVVPAVIAGKFMTNSFVFGEIFNMDIYLWKIWNIMKNFANYFIWFAFVYKVLMYLFQKEVQSTLSKFIVKILMSAVLVQSSWFLMWALVDLSNIMTSAVGAFSVQFVETSDYKSKMENIKAQIPEKCTIDSSRKDIQWLIPTCEWTTSVDIEKLLPSYNSISGPLLFIWYWVLRFQDFNFTNDKSYTCTSMSFSEIFKSLMIIMFVIPIILLLVVNVIRIVYIWLWVSISPLIVVYNVFWKEMFKSSWSWWDKVDWKNIVWLIFQPVAVTAALSFSLILLIWVKAMLLETNSKALDFKSFTYSQSIDSANIKVPFEEGYSQPSIEIKWNIFKDIWSAAWWFLWYLIIYLLAMFLIRWVMKAWFETSKLTSSITNWAFKFVESMTKAVPIMPWWIWIKAATDWFTRMKDQATKRVVWEDQTKVIDSVMGKFFKTHWWVGSYRTEIDMLLRQWWDERARTKRFIWKLRDIQSTRSYWLSTDPAFKEVVLQWISDKDVQRMLWIDKMPEKTEDILNDPYFMKLLDFALKWEITEDMWISPSTLRTKANSNTDGPSTIKTRIYWKENSKTS